MEVASEGESRTDELPALDFPVYFWTPSTTGTLGRAVVFHERESEFPKFQDVIRRIAQFDIPQQRITLPAAILHGESETPDTVLVP
jgi:hypothetical protein